MKALVASIVCLIAGVAIGFFIGYRYYERNITSEAIHQMLQTSKSSDREQAARDTRAIELLQSGQTQKAIQMLSRPIADYYYLYAGDVDTNLDPKIRAAIDQLASTNPIVAAVMTNEKASYEYRTK